jgi:hypothetical protein
MGKWCGLGPSTHGPGLLQLMVDQGAWGGGSSSELGLTAAPVHGTSS